MQRKASKSPKAPGVGSEWEKHQNLQNHKITNSTGCWERMSKRNKSTGCRERIRKTAESPKSPRSSKVPGVGEVMRKATKSPKSSKSTAFGSGRDKQIYEISSYFFSFGKFLCFQFSSSPLRGLLNLCAFRAIWSCFLLLTSLSAHHSFAEFVLSGYVLIYWEYPLPPLKAHCNVRSLDDFLPSKCINVCLVIFAVFTSNLESKRPLWLRTYSCFIMILM